ncbi:MAG: hypothetical protein JWM59_3270 [Verrucomicrobiales bacterium]|nr:hypothetical protein [Verrucomicrobiales bacterium]
MSKHPRRPVPLFVRPVFRSTAAASLLLALPAVLSAQDEKAKPEPAPPAAAAAPVVPEPVKIDFSNDEPGELPSDYMTADAEAKFTIEDDGGNRVLRLNPSPIVDGGVLLGKSVKGGASITARIHATGKRRSFPRFGVGLHGVSGYRLLAAPADKELQLVKDDMVAARVPLEWKSGSWAFLEFSVTSTADGGSALEGRIWEEGQSRPETAQLTFAVKTPPATGKASVWAAPYSGQPVDFDDIIITARP